MNGTQERAEPMNQQQPASSTPPPPAAPAPQPAARIEDPRRKSPPLACILSAMPGLGQIYVGYYQRGFIHAFVIAGMFFILNVISDRSPLFPAAVVFMIFFWFYNIIDAGRRASLYNQLLLGRETVELPEDLRLPGIRGSVFGGVILIIAGGIILSHTAYDLSLAWLEDWWPVGLLLIGGYLIFKGIQERAGARSRQDLRRPGGLQHLGQRREHQLAGAGGRRRALREFRHLGGASSGDGADERPSGGTELRSALLQSCQ